MCVCVCVCVCVYVCYVVLQSVNRYYETANDLFLSKVRVGKSIVVQILFIRQLVQVPYPS